MNHTFEELLEGTRQAQGTARIMADRHLQKAHQAAIAQAVEKVENRSCPCLYTTPCNPGMAGCTCVNSISSGGCLRCATYGSLEQRGAKAEYLASIIDHAMLEADNVAKGEGG